MKLITVNENEAGQRLDRLLAKYMDRAPKSFFYKMLRKKNITLNKKKAVGNERLSVGDEIRLFLAEETIQGFSTPRCAIETSAHCGRPDVIYENAHILLLNKPAGILSQKAEPGDVSLVEQLTAYLLETGQLKEEDLRSFRPGICSRLDRNTSGLTAAGKSLAGLQAMNELFRTRSVKKFYRCIALGTIEQEQRVEGWLKKDERANRVTVYNEEQEGSQYICTEYRPLEVLSLGGRACTYLEVHLITGRSHQIRAHLAGIGHPLLGDSKYGNAGINRAVKERFGLNAQLLHAFRIEFPSLEGTLEDLSQREFTAPLPGRFRKVLEAGQDPRCVSGQIQI